MKNRKGAFSLTGAFAGATATLAQQEELKRLREELDELKRQKTPSLSPRWEELIQKLKNVGGEVDIPISDMKPSRQARQTFTRSAVLKRAQSLLQHGQQTPVILVPTESGERPFSIEDGELRWRAAALLVERGDRDWEKLKSVFAPPPLGSTEIHKRSLIHNLHREDLNPLDRVEAVIEQIRASVDLSSGDGSEPFDSGSELPAEVLITRHLRNLDYRLKRNNTERAKFLKLLESSRDEQIQRVSEFTSSDTQQKILLVLLELQLNVCSLAANDLPMLSLPADLKEAIRSLDLPCHHALAIAKLSKDKLGVTEEEAIAERSTLTRQVIEASLSLKKTRELVALTLTRYGLSLEGRTSRKALSEIETALNRIALSEFDREGITRLKKTLSDKLREIEQIEAFSG